MGIQYINENLTPGNWGYFFIVLSFCAAIAGLFSYIFYAKDEKVSSWKTIGRASFLIHGLAVM